MTLATEPVPSADAANDAAPGPASFHDALTTEAGLPWAPLVDALARMMVRKQAGQTQSPERLALPLTGGVLLAMPATDGQYVSTKIVTVHADNPRRGLPSVQSEVTLMRADTGQRLAILDGQVVTARRTAAISLLAIARLATSAPPTRALIVGAGAQAAIHLRALAEHLGIRDVAIASRTTASSDRLVDQASRWGVRATRVDDLDAEVASHRLIVLATTATAPVIPDRVRDDALVVAVGAYRPEMCELPASLVRRARVYVDDAAGARHEAGDLLQAGVDWSGVTPLEDIVAGRVPPPAASAEKTPIVFKSVGQALWDLAACRLVIGD